MSMMAVAMAASSLKLLLALALLGPAAHAYVDQPEFSEGGKMCYHITDSLAFEDNCNLSGYFWIKDPGTNVLGSGWCCPCPQGTYERREACIKCPLGYTTAGGRMTKESDCKPAKHLEPGNRFALRTSRNTYVGLRSDTPTGPSQLQAVYPWVGGWETIEAVASLQPKQTTLDGYVNTQLAFKMPYLRSSNKGLVTNAIATASTPVITNHASAVDAYEHMIVEPRTGDGGVSIRAASLRHVWQAVNGGGGDIVLRNTPVGSAERFNVVFHGGLREGQVVALKTSNGRYVSTSAPQGKTVQEVHSAPRSIEQWEKWVVMLPEGSNGNVIALRSLSYVLDYDGKQRMLTALSDGAMRVIWSTKNDVKTQWEIIPRRDGTGAAWVSLRNLGVNNGYNYMRAENGGGSAVNINSLQQGEWERFQIVPAY